MGRLNANPCRALAAAAVLAAGCGTVLAIDDDPPSRPPGPALADASGAGPDALTDAVADARSDDPAVQVSGKVVFVTRAGLAGGVGLLGSDKIPRQGRDAFDAMCAVEAQNAGLAGSFVAWMSVAVDSATAHAIDRLKVGAPWYLPSTNGAGPSAELVFPDKAYIAAGGAPMVAITRGADGVTVVPDAATSAVWTGTDARGKALAPDCDGWQSGASDALGTIGKLGAVTDAWTNASGAGNCSQPYHAICFQQ